MCLTTEFLPLLSNLNNSLTPNKYASRLNIAAFSPLRCFAEAFAFIGLLAYVPIDLYTQIHSYNFFYHFFIINADQSCAHKVLMKIRQRKLSKYREGVHQVSLIGQVCLKAYKQMISLLCT